MEEHQEQRCHESFQALWSRADFESARRRQTAGLLTPESRAVIDLNLPRNSTEATMCGRYSLGLPVSPPSLLVVKITWLQDAAHRQTTSNTSTGTPRSGSRSGSGSTEVDSSRDTTSLRGRMHPCCAGAKRRRLRGPTSSSCTP